MQILSASECTKWLDLRSMPHSPYSNSPSGFHYVRLTPPKVDEGARLVAAALFTSARPSEMMVEVTDWSGPSESETLPTCLKQAEPGPHISAYQPVGLVFEENEALSAAECCAFVVSCGMSAYAYFPADHLVVYLWEGDFVELWCPSASTISVLSRNLVGAGCRLVR